MWTRIPLIQLALLLIALDAPALGLYGVLRDADGPVLDSLVQLDSTTGAATTVAALPTRIWGDLAGRAGDPTGLYSVSRVPGAGFVTQVSRIDTGTAAVDDLYSFTASDFGFGPTFGLELSGISIEPGQSSHAIVTAELIDLTFQQETIDALFELDLDTGASSSLLMLSGKPSSMLLSDLSHAPDGVLFGKLDGFPPPPVVGTVDLVTGVVDTIGGPPEELRSLAFDPDTGELFATTGASTLALPGVVGELHVISPTTGELLETRGSVLLEGSINALGFVIPEPGTGLLVLVGLSLFGTRRTRTR